MALRFLSFLILLFGCACAAPASKGAEEPAKAVSLKLDVEDKEDLRTAASSAVSRRYADWNSYPSSAYTGYSYGVTGYGSGIDSRYNTNYGSGYDNTYGSGGYGSGGYGGYGSGGYGSQGYGGYGSGGYGSSGYGGYGSSGYDGYSRGYGLTGSSNGGYGGFGGNGGLSSYYGYSNPSYQGNYNLGYGYYNNRRPGAGYGNIYNSGITPSLVTGYRGYSKR